MTEKSFRYGKHPQEVVAEIICSEDRVSCNKKYDQWADFYEADMSAVEYDAPAKLMEYIPRLNLSKEAKILDVCAGTGAVARNLVKLGFSNIHSIDGSEKMLAKAKQEGNYKSYTQMLFEPGSRFPFTDGEFDCVLLSGVFAPGHLPIVALKDCCRITKVGGVVATICCDPIYYSDADKQYSNNGFFRIVDELKDKGIWKEHEGFPVSIPYIEYSRGYVMAFDITAPSL